MLKLTAIGNVGQDAKVNDYSGRKAIQFSIAHNENFTNKDGVKESKTTWVNCVIWREAGKTEIAKYLTAGTRVYVEGRPAVRTYTKQDQTTGASLDCNVTQIELLGSPRNSQPGNHEQTTAPEPEEKDERPFKPNPEAGSAENIPY